MGYILAWGTRIINGANCARLQAGVEDIMDKSNNQPNFGNIMSTCRSLLQQFLNFKINFIRRQANYVAHTSTRG